MCRIITAYFGCRQFHRARGDHDLCYVDTEYCPDAGRGCTMSEVYHEPKYDDMRKECLDCQAAAL
ncbi:hypothetical protein MAPG_11192 [Magnaporthiopsis poae ATCC 64411]|uniref:Uncharacterized protein n=1 Tax=Magnaporthiopsis poae (strain ATCC 64411 / 73-15) TaxID=644358 RepID=A0A0C4EEL8_MAGP6|nr:hypothetical protein MAPG_11192 [Magnaporthiopsis poae ATCC 64411]